jgi:hypothetical protein
VHLNFNLHCQVLCIDGTFFRKRVVQGSLGIGHGDLEKTLSAQGPQDAREEREDHEGGCQAHSGIESEMWRAGAPMPFFLQKGKGVSNE